MSEIRCQGEKNRLARGTKLVQKMRKQDVENSIIIDFVFSHFRLVVSCFCIRTFVFSHVETAEKIFDDPNGTP